MNRGKCHMQKRRAGFGLKVMVMVGIQLRGHIFRVKTRSKQTDRLKSKQKKPNKKSYQESWSFK